MRNQDFNLLSCNACGAVLDRRAVKIGAILSTGTSMICPVCKAEISMEDGAKHKPSAEPMGFDTYELTAGLQRPNRPAQKRVLSAAELRDEAVKRLNLRRMEYAKLSNVASDDGNFPRAEFFRGASIGVSRAMQVLNQCFSDLTKGGRL